MVRLRTSLLVMSGVVLALTAGIGPSMAAQEKVTICHKPGTPDEAELSVGAPSVRAHQAHGDTLGPCGPPPSGCATAVSDVCLDGDGIASPLAGTFDVQVGDTLASFPDLSFNSGLDLFDRAPLGVLTSDDDLHVEDPSFPGCATAVRDGVHQLGLDCKVLDVNGDLADLELVTADCEGGFGTCLTLKYRDDNLNGEWDNGEDLVIDTNMNGIFD